MSRNTPGYGAVILRDTVYGAGFGAAAGGIVGTLAFISTKESEHILLGAAVGALVGAAAGVALGVIEGNKALDETAPRTAHGSPSPWPLPAASRAAWSGCPTFAGRY